MITRRAVLGGIVGSALMPSLAQATSAWPPLASIVNSALFQGGWARGNLGYNKNSGGPLLLDGLEVPLSESGDFFLGFDRDAKPIATLAWQVADGPIVKRDLQIASRAWSIEHVDAPFHPPAMLDETFATTRKDELAHINAARAINTGAQGWAQKFQWPGKGRISGLFGSQRTYQGGVAGSYHSGTDIALPAGTPYLAPADGVVTLAADHPFTLEGNLLMLDHGMGLNSAFLHSSALLVKEGERVSQGQPIGQVGMTGRATGPHLHWSLRWREARLDPMLFAGTMP